MTDKGQLFVTEALRDEVETRAKELSVKLPVGFSVNDLRMPKHLDTYDMRPGHKGIAELFDGNAEPSGKIYYRLVLNPDYTGDCHEDLVVLGDIFVILISEVEHLCPNCQEEIIDDQYLDHYGGICQRCGYDFLC